MPSFPERKFKTQEEALAWLRSEKKTITIAGAAMNVRRFLDKVFVNISAVADLFENRVRIIFFENDSNDKTLEKLQEYKLANDSKFPVTIMVEKGWVQLYPERLDRLYRARNRLLEEAITHPTDYYLLIDMDDVNQEPWQTLPSVSTSGSIEARGLPSGEGLPSVEELPLTGARGFLTCFQYDESQWDAIFVNQKKYYDIYALRCPTMITTDCWNDYYVRMGFSGNRQDLIRHWEKEAVYQYQCSIEERFPHTKLIPVVSAFGGAGLYRMTNEFKKCRYSCAKSINMTGKTCEHVPFHEQLFSYGGRLWINVDWINID